MAYMKDLDGTRLDTFPVPDRRQVPIRVPVTMTNGVMQGVSTSSSSTGYWSRTVAVAAVACRDITLLWTGGWYMSNAAEIVSPNSIQIKAAIEYGGTIYPVTFRGDRTPTVSPWGNIESDPLGLELPAGAVFYVRLWVSSSTGQSYPTGFAPSLPGITISGTVGWGTGDSVDSGTPATSDGTFGFWNPIVRGIPNAPTEVWGIIGCSIEAGELQTQRRAYWKYGFESNPRPVMTYARSGGRFDKIAQFHHRGFPLLRGCTDVVMGVNPVNDFTNSRTLAQVKADAATIVTALRDMGVERIHGTTITPISTSSDSWVTEGNQTVNSSYQTLRAQYNTWALAGADGLYDGTIDLAPSIESVSTPGKWLANMTTDGIHPNSAGHAAMGDVFEAYIVALG